MISMLLNELPIDKLCARCKKVKPANEFYIIKSVLKRGAPRQKLMSRCKFCQYELNAASKSKVPREKRNAEAKVRMDRLKAENPERYILMAIKSRSVMEGIEFNLTESDLKIPELCPVFGTELLSGRAPGKRTDATPTVDRIEPSRGYTKGNVRVISWRANRLKNNATLEEIEAIAAYMRRELKK